MPRTTLQQPEGRLVLTSQSRETAQRAAARLGIKTLVDRICEYLPGEGEAIVWFGCYSCAGYLAPVWLRPDKHGGNNCQGDVAMLAFYMEAMRKLLPGSPFWWDELGSHNEELMRLHNVKHGCYGELYVHRTQATQPR